MAYLRGPGAVAAVAAYYVGRKQFWGLVRFLTLCVAYIIMQVHVAMHVQSAVQHSLII
jgi:hypothetical protein